MPNLELPEEPGTGVAEDIIRRLLPEWWAKFAPKNKAYGATLSRGGGLGIKAFIPEMNRKMQGIVNQVWHDEPQGEGESAREKAMDLIGHLFIFVSNLDAKNEAGCRPGLDSAAIVDRALGVARAARLTGEDGRVAGLRVVDEAGRGVPGVHVFLRKPMGEVPHNHAFNEICDESCKGTGNTFTALTDDPDLVF